MKKTKSQVVMWLVMVIVICFTLTSCGLWGTKPAENPPPWDKVKELAIFKGKPASGGCHAYRVTNVTLDVSFVYCTGDNSVSLIKLTNQEQFAVGLGSVSGKRQAIWIDMSTGRLRTINDKDAATMAYQIFRDLVTNNML